jgi:ribosomal protein S18 acetylase RimI-like enzyme
MTNDEQIRQAADMTLSIHRELLVRSPWLPEKTLADYLPRLEWMMREGSVFGLFDKDCLSAFMGWFPLENFRNAGPGALTPDWCFGTHPGIAPSGTRSSGLMTPLIKTVLADLKTRGFSLHGVGIPAHREELRELFSLTGYGHIVLDAARPRKELLTLLEGEHPDLNPPGSPVLLRVARPGDGSRLAELDGKLAAHIGASPVLMPATHGSTVEEWEEWLADPESVTFLATEGSATVGFIKASEPQFDVSYTVHGPATLAICGLWVEPALRRQSLARRLLTALVREGEVRGKELISVDCETTNPEARGFWLRYFRPITWSLERRF